MTDTAYLLQYFLEHSPKENKDQNTKKTMAKIKEFSIKPKEEKSHE